MNQEADPEFCARDSGILSHSLQSLIVSEDYVLIANQNDSVDSQPVGSFMWIDELFCGVIMRLVRSMNQERHKSALT